MSSARLEVITDDPTVAPRLSRSVPAALDGIVSTVAFRSFCEKLDGLFDELDAEQRRRKKRVWWMYGTIYFWVVYLLVIVPTNADSSITMLVSLCLCALHISTVWTCTARPAGAKADSATLRDIRLECDEMTNRTPFVSFQAVLMPVPISGRISAWLQMNTVDHIVVSVSASASASGAATAVSAVMADAHDAKAHEAADNQEPVVYAQAVGMSSGYQQVATTSGVELV